jgi:RNA recognition motif-containing protein
MKGPDNEVKLFVGGLAFVTQEEDLINYFKDFGLVVGAIVMRDRAT